MSTKQTRMHDRIIAHGNKLNAIFHTAFDSETLCKKLKRIENKQNRANTDYCNGDIDMDQHDAITEQTSKALKKVLGDKVPLYINSDPRGYALKIDDGIVRELNLDIYRDWGGYGILAPDFSEE